ncbi:MAG: ribosome maturation factor RimP [Ignavibacteriaceae bacterium]
MEKKHESHKIGVQEKAILQVCERIAEESQCMLIDIFFRGQKGNLVIEMFIDREDHLSVENCADISRLIVDEVEKQDMIKGSFRLDVSSPGTDRPLKFLKQYKKHIDRTFEVIVKDETEPKKKISGKLVSIDGDNLLFRDKKNEYLIKFDNIVTAKVLITFSDGGKK